MDVNLHTTLYRLAGLVAILLAIGMLPHVISLGLLFDSEHLPHNVGVYAAVTLVPFVLVLGIGCWLVFGIKRPTMPSTDGGEAPGAEASVAQVTASMLLAVGILLIGFSMSRLVPVATELAYLYAEDSVWYRSSRAGLVIWGDLIGASIPLVIGLVLVLKTSTIATLFKRRWDRTRPVAADAQCPHCGFWIIKSEYRAGAAGYRCDNCKQELPRDVVESTSRASDDS